MFRNYLEKIPFPSCAWPQDGHGHEIYFIIRDLKMKSIYNGNIEYVVHISKKCK